MQSKLVYAGRGAEILVGLLYLTAALLKAQNINLFIGQILAYQIFSSTGALTFVALTTLALETFLGFSMVAGSPWRKAVLAAGMAMLAFFTVLIIYAWQVHNLKDCGCFGKVSMTPPQAILKNLVLMAMTGLAWYGLLRRGEGEGHSAMKFPGMRRALPLVLALILSAAAIPQLGGKAPGDAVAVEVNADTSAAPGAVPSESAVFAGYRITPDYGDVIDLSKGEYLVALLSMTCEHCMGTVPQLNEYTFESALPKLVAICLEPVEGSLADFQGMTGPMFPMHSIGNDMLAWAKLCSGVPPQLCLVRDGAIIETWKDEMPGIETLLAAVSPEANADTAELPE